MPLDPNLNIVITPAQKLAIETDLINAKNAIEAVIAHPLNLSKRERQFTPSIGTRREPYVREAIEVLAPQFPNLVEVAIPTSQAENLWQFCHAGRTFLALLDEMRDRVLDATINAENTCLHFAEDMRKVGKRYKDRNVPGADVVWDRLKDLHRKPERSEVGI